MRDRCNSHKLKGNVLSSSGTLAYMNGLVRDVMALTEKQEKVQACKTWHEESWELTELIKEKNG